MKEKFWDAYVWEIEYDKLITYRSGKTVYSECFQQGRLCAAGWNTEGYLPQTNTMPRVARFDPTLFTKPETFAIQLDGIDLNYSYDWVSFETKEENGGLHAMLRLQSVTKSVEVTVHTVMDGTDVLQRYLTVENQSDGPLALSGLTVLSGALMQEALENERELPFELGYMHAAQACREGDFHWTTLPRNTFSFGKAIYEERYRTPFFMVHQPKTGQLFVGQLGFSGGYQMSFHNTVYTYGVQACLSFEAAISSASPLRVISAGERMQSPTMHFMMTMDGLDGAVQALHTHLRAYSDDFPKDGSIQVPLGPESYMGEEMVWRAIDRAVELDAEVFYLDAAWYSPDGGESTWWDYCGDWEPREWRYKSSMDDFREAVHQKGMKFGLWMDVEKLGPKSNAVKNPDIPQLQGYAGRTMDAQSGGLDASHPDGIEWAYQQICGVIDRYKLDYFRLDSGATSYTSRRTVDGINECVDLRYYENWYDLFRRLRRKYPDVIFQNCAGGGMRIDPGMMQPMCHTQISDNCRAPYNFAILNGVSLMLPINKIASFMTAIGGHTAGTMRFQINVARFGVPMLATQSPAELVDNPYYIDLVKKMLNTYRAHIRPMMENAKVYHHTPELHYDKPGCFGVLEMASENQKTALLAAFTLSNVLEPVHTLRFKGLSRVCQYDLWQDDEYIGTFSGYFLMEEGLKVEIPETLDSKSYLAVAVSK